MPGILPMKVIKVGTSAQSRIAQACDRCRSKKIRCDGIRPCCSQCSNVGFECKTSDKLSRRAFPRGYTESLEERVRALESEVRELKDLLDEKDEKIDMLSKIQSHRRPSSSSKASSPLVEIAPTPPKEDVFRVQASPLLLGVEDSDSYFMGASSGRAFADAFKRKMQERGKSLAGFNTEAFLNVQAESNSGSPARSPTKPLNPPRMFSDRCVNVYFQEWAPLFPVLHKPTFLRIYEEYMSNPDQVTDSHKLAQLHLVLAIAGLSSDTPDREQIVSCENQWRAALDNVLMDNTLSTLQCLILAMIYCISKADYNRLQHYKGIAVGLSHRLGLHQSQKRFSFGALTIETRKKVFWTLYTVDCFSAALLGLPKLLKEEECLAEYPADTDDEYVTEKGFLPTLPGESTRISSALALFRVSRILTTVLNQNYPAAATHDLSLQSLINLDNELNDWSEKLPQHLKLTFVQDKPSTDVTGSRSAILSLAFYYIRSLIHRPAVGSSLGNKSSPSVISLADSSKHIIQIVQLLKERGMSFSFCLNKNEMLTLCGLSILYQGIDLKQEGKLKQDGERLVAVVVNCLEKADAPGAVSFKRLAFSLMSLDQQCKSNESINGRIGESVSKAFLSLRATQSPPNSRRQLQNQLYRHASASMSESDLLAQQAKLRRATLPAIPILSAAEALQRYGRNSSDSSRSEDIPRIKREYRTSSVPQVPAMVRNNTIKNLKPPNLDYLSLSNTPIASSPASPSQRRTHQPQCHTPIFPTSMYGSQKTLNSSTATPSELELLLGGFDDRHLYEAIYGGGHPSSGPTPALSIPDQVSSNLGSWSPDSWDYTIGMGDSFSGAAANSVLSFSEESLSSGDELSGSDLLMPAPSQSMNADNNDGYDYLLNGLDNTFAL